MITPLINAPSLWLQSWPVCTAESHKYTRGSVLIIGGYPMTGAAKLAAMAAARMGAGLTSIAVPEIAWSAYASTMLSVIVKPYYSLDSLNEMIANPRTQAYVIGPGAGVSATTLTITQTILATGKPVIIDADAIKSFDGDLATLKYHGSAKVVLTPHAGEFKHLFAAEPSDDLATRITQVVKAAAESQCIVLLKGASTVIATPDGQVLLHQHAPHALATAGAGDVLAGLIASGLAQGMPALQACGAACWVHGEAAFQFGQGLIADDLPAMIPRVLEALKGPSRN